MLFLFHYCFNTNTNSHTATPSQTYSEGSTKKWRNTFKSILFAFPIAFIIETFTTWLSLSLILAFCKESIKIFSKLPISFQMICCSNQNLTSILNNSSWNTETNKLWWLKLAKRASANNNGLGVVCMSVWGTTNTFPG